MQTLSLGVPQLSACLGPLLRAQLFYDLSLIISSLLCWLPWIVNFHLQWSWKTDSKLLLWSDRKGWEDVASDADEDLESDEGQMEGIPDEAEESASGKDHLGDEAIPVTNCLFCPHHSSSLMKNVAHMTKVHSFFIPDIEYLVDLRGLIQYLGTSVGSSLLFIR